jgi:hypothetical protein
MADVRPGAVRAFATRLPAADAFLSDTNSGQFVRQKDETAWSSSSGGMALVMGVCQRVLRTTGRRTPEPLAHPRPQNATINRRVKSGVSSTRWVIVRPPRRAAASSRLRGKAGEVETPIQAGRSVGEQPIIDAESTDCPTAKVPSSVASKAGRCNSGARSAVTVPWDTGYAGPGGSSAPVGPSRGAFAAD